MLAQEASGIYPQQKLQALEPLQNLLHLEINQLGALLEILESEKEALAGHDPDRIEAITRQKKTAVSDVERASVQRLSYVQNLGIDPQAENWVEQLGLGTDELEQLLETYRHLLSLTNRCRSLNQINGLLINRRELLTSKVINLLRANNSPEIYSNSGYSESHSDSRMLGKA